MATEWYRKKGWSPKRREEFFARLRRCREKSEYVRVQGQELLDTKSRRSHLGALELFELYLREYPGAGLQFTVYDGIAECRVRLGELDRAVEAYRRLFRVMRKHKDIQPHSAFEFGWLVVSTPLPKLYAEALAVLDEFSQDTFPIDRYRDHLLRALIFAARGKRRKARQHARAALAETAITHSGLRYHPTFGLVKKPDKKVYEQLQNLAV